MENNHSFQLNEQRISSTAIRKALAEDNLILAKQLLGKPYCIHGKVMRNKLGRTIGFPTATFAIEEQVNPIKGVYIVKAKLEDNTFFNGVALI